MKSIESRLEALEKMASAQKDPLRIVMKREEESDQQACSREGLAIGEYWLILSEFDLAVG